MELWKRYATVSVACYVICVLDCMHRHQCIIRPENVKTPLSSGNHSYIVNLDFLLR